MENIDKSSWLLLDEDARIDLLSCWLDKLLEIKNNKENLREKKEIERNIFSIIEWAKEYE